MQTRQRRNVPGKRDRSTRRLKDVDAAEWAGFFRAAVWLAPVSLLIFGFTTAAAAQLGGMGPAKALVFGLVVGLLGPWIAYGLLYKYVIGGTASLLGRVYYSGESTSRGTTAWRAEALSARGSHGEALEAFEEEAAEHPDDPGPCLRAAALCLHELDDPESAIRFFLRAREAADTTAGTDAYISFRLADLYETLGASNELALELKRLLQLHPDSQHAPGARARLAELRRRQIGESRD